MSIDKKYFEHFIKATELAAIGAFPHIGKGDKVAADQGSVDKMRSQLNNIVMDGTVVIGEGEMDEAPMLYIGEKVGKKGGQSLDIALDPLEGTNFVANDLPGALSVIAVAEKSNLFNAPETYMDKISANVNERDVVDLDFPLKKNIFNLAEYKNKDPKDMTVCLLDRPRHKQIIDELSNIGVKLKLITDGDVSGALLVSEDKYKVDLFLGEGGGPEGVLAAAALDAFGCFFQGKFLFKTDLDKERAKSMGINDFDKKYYLEEIVSGDSIFCATGITSGDLVSGIRLDDNIFFSETLITHKSSGLKKTIKKHEKI